MDLPANGRKIDARLAGTLFFDELPAIVQGAFGSLDHCTVRRHIETAEDAIALLSPESLRVSVGLPHRGAVAGLGIPKGVTFIVGGGYHGKSTLLHAIESVIYDHIPVYERELARGQNPRLQREARVIG
jgi:predicted ABC-class ATPase